MTYVYTERKMHFLINICLNNAGWIFTKCKHIYLVQEPFDLIIIFYIQQIFIFRT